jgi:hypothetical protein
MCITVRRPVASCDPSKSALHDDHKNPSYRILPVAGLHEHGHPPQVVGRSGDRRSRNGALHVDPTCRPRLVATYTADGEC